MKLCQHYHLMVSWISPGFNVFSKIIQTLPFWHNFSKMGLFSKIFSICILAATDFQEVEFGRGGRRIFKRRGDDAALPALETKEEKAKKKSGMNFWLIYLSSFIFTHPQSWTMNLNTPCRKKRRALCFAK